MHVAKWWMCLKGCISRCAVKSSGIWEVTLAFTSRLPPRGLLNGVTAVLLNGITAYTTIVMLMCPLRMCLKKCISRCAVKSSGIWKATLAFTSRLPPRGLLNGVTVVLLNGISTYNTILKLVCPLRMCLKGCISRCAVKSSGIWEATLPFTSGLATCGLLNGVTAVLLNGITAYNTIFKVKGVIASITICTHPNCNCCLA